MESATPRFKKYIFVCENRRDEGACCGPASERIRERLKDAVKARGLEGTIRVSRSGCLDVCAEGPNVLISPDNVWLKHVSESDVEEILRMAAGAA